MKFDIAPESMRAGMTSAPDNCTGTMNEREEDDVREDRSDEPITGRIEPIST